MWLPWLGRLAPMARGNLLGLLAHGALVRATSSHGIASLFSEVIFNLFQLHTTLLLLLLLLRSFATLFKGVEAKMVMGIADGDDFQLARCLGKAGRAVEGVRQIRLHMIAS